MIASEVGVLDIAPAEIVESGRLEPGRMLLLDTNAGPLVPRRRGQARRWPRRRPYRRWLDENKLFLADLRPRQVEALPPDELAPPAAGLRLHQEELRLLIGPMARDGAEPVGSMGDDTPLAALSERPKLLSAVLQAALRAGHEPAHRPAARGARDEPAHEVGAIGNLLGERPRTAAGCAMPTPVLQNGELEKLRHAATASGFRPQRCRRSTPSPRAPAGLERAIDALCRAGLAAVWDGTTILILSDRGVDDDHAPIAPLLATAAVHSHLVREGARTMCGLVVESGEPRETMHVALLLGYGAVGREPVPRAGDAARAARGRRARRADARRGAPALRQRPSARAC